MENFIREYRNQFPDSFCDQLIDLLEDNEKWNSYKKANIKSSIEKLK